MAAAELGLPLPEIDAAELTNLQDPIELLASRNGLGSASDVETMIQELRTIIDNVPPPRFSDFEERYMRSVQASIMERTAE